MTKNDFLRRANFAICKASESLKRTQAPYKRSLDSSVRQVSTHLSPGDFVYLDLKEVVSKRERSASSAIASSKLLLVAVRPFRVLSNDERTVVIGRYRDIERVSANQVIYVPWPQEALQSTRTPQNLASKVREGQSYVVEKVSTIAVTAKSASSASGPHTKRPLGNLGRTSRRS